jgi:hypothetical protein
MFSWGRQFPLLTRTEQILKSVVYCAILGMPDWRVKENTYVKTSKNVNALDSLITNELRAAE